MDSKVVLITGGTRGIGQALALSLAARGHLIAVTGRNPDHLEATRKLLPKRSLTIAADVSNEAETTNTIEQVLAHFGHIDVLINNAGISGPGGPVWLTSPQQWREVYETNVMGPVLYIHGVLPDMIERKTGTIINIGSYAGIRPLPGNSAYGSSKTALIRITDSIAAEVDDFGISVFCLSPGLVETDMTRDVPVFKDIPKNEWSKPDDICTLVYELLNGDFHSLSGRFIHVKDDLEALRKDSELIKSKSLYQLRMTNLEGLID